MQSFTVKLGSILTMDQQGQFVLLDGIGNVVKAKRLPIKTQYHIAKIAKHLAGEVSSANEKRVELVKQFGEEVMEEYEENGEKKKRSTDRWSVPIERMRGYVEALNELLGVEVEVHLRPLKLQELGEPEGTTAQDLMACQAFIIDE